MPTTQKRRRDNTMRRGTDATWTLRLAPGTTKGAHQHVMHAKDKREMTTAGNKETVTATHQKTRRTKRKETRTVQVGRRSQNGA